ncbi:hypothetical protein HN935_03560 [archaeon]|nr:hypothetical protein [archaeon]
MITAFLLAISISIALASLVLIIVGSTGLIRENLATGAVIGVGETISYATVSLIIFLVISVVLIIVLKNKN